jgi:hypothetical protein
VLKRWLKREKADRRLEFALHDMVDNLDISTAERWSPTINYIFQNGPDLIRLFNFQATPRRSATTTLPASDASCKFASTTSTRSRAA